jgi:hypothetical protein
VDFGASTDEPPPPHATLVTRTASARNLNMVKHFAGAMR